MKEDFPSDFTNKQIQDAVLFALYINDAFIDADPEKKKKKRDEIVLLEKVRNKINTSTQQYAPTDNLIRDLVK